MLRKIHRIMQQPRYFNHVIPDPKQNQMAWLGNLRAGGQAFAAGRQVVSTDAFANILPMPHTRADRVSAQVVQCGVNQLFIADASGIAKGLLRPFKNLRDVLLRRG